MRTVFRYGVALYVAMMLAGALGEPTPAASQDASPAQPMRARDRRASGRFPAWMRMNWNERRGADRGQRCLDHPVQ